MGLLRDPFLTSEHIVRVQRPLLIIHGDADRIIPLDNGQRLYELANGAKRLHVVKGGGHNDLYSFPILDVIEPFVNGARP